MSQGDWPGRAAISCCTAARPELGWAAFPGTPGRSCAILKSEWLTREWLPCPGRSGRNCATDTRPESGWPAWPGRSPRSAAAARPRQKMCLRCQASVRLASPVWQSSRKLRHSRARPASLTLADQAEVVPPVLGSNQGGQAQIEVVLRMLARVSVANLAWQSLCHRHLTRVKLTGLAGRPDRICATKDGLESWWLGCLGKGKPSRSCATNAGLESLW